MSGTTKEFPTDVSTSVTSQRTVVIAATAGTVMEWYDFFMYISVTSSISANFFSDANPVAANIFALLTFATGYLVRPFGALVFGRLGDLIGRKHTFLVTIVMMGFSTVAVGLLPSYSSIGLAAPSFLIFLRMIQGLALGGEYGGAATYIAEHAMAGRRGALTSWLQTSATVGFALSVLVVLLTRMTMSADAFNAWGWRLLFLTSIVPLALSIWVRVKLQESPLFLQMKRDGALSKSPIRDTLASWPNLKRVLIAMVAMVAPQSVLLVGAQIYSLVFLIGTVKVDPQTANLLVLSGLVLGLPSFVIAGTLSDRFGTRIFILSACLIGALTYVPLFKALTFYANPALYSAQTNVAITVAADPVECSAQFNPIGTTRYTSGCDVAKAALVRLGAPYSVRMEASGTSAVVQIGSTVVPVIVIGAAADLQTFTNRLRSSLAEAGYPSEAKRSAMNVPMIILILAALSSIAGMIFGPLASALTTLFPARIRYTSVSFSYHVGNGIFGGLLPAVATTLQTTTGDIYAGIYYVVAISAISFVFGLLLLRPDRSAAVVTASAQTAS